MHWKQGEALFVEVRRLIKWNTDNANNVNLDLPVSRPRPEEQPVITTSSEEWMQMDVLTKRNKEQVLNELGK